MLARGERASWLNRSDEAVMRLLTSPIRLASPAQKRRSAER